MYKVLVTVTFDAAHKLDRYPGPCSRLHGHTYTITAEWAKPSLDHIGMALDMVELKKQLRHVVVDMDHYYLNKIRELKNTTAECIAQLLFTRLANKELTGNFLSAVTVEETPGCSVRYEETQKLLVSLNTPSLPPTASPEIESDDERLERIGEG